MAISNTDDNTDTESALGLFAERLKSWNRVIATVPLAMKPEAFQRCLVEAATFVEQGAPRGRIADELIKCADAHNLVDTLGGLSNVEQIVGDALAEAETPRQKVNGPDKTEPKPNISATPFQWHDPADIPSRKWLYGRHYARQFLTCTIATSGMGKTSLAIGEALAMASGKPLLGITPPERARVWIWNGEDPRDELDRRIIVAMVYYGLSPADVDGHLFTDVGRSMPIIIATQTRQGAIIAKPVVDAVIAAIRENKIDVLIVDPFIKSHRVIENDNNAMDLVATEWAHIADVTNCAVELLHHTRKTGGAEVSVEDGRGAGAVVSASRSARVLNRMIKEDAAKAGIADADAWRYFRVDNGKASMAPPEHAVWYQLATVPLGNGDTVGVATGWSWPDPFLGVTVKDIRRAQKAVSEGGPWRANVQASNWVGKPIAKALGLNIKSQKDRAKVRTLLKAWIANGDFVVVAWCRR